MRSALVVLLGAAGIAAQPRLAIRFDNGQSEITVAPGSQVHVTAWATNMPAVGTQIPWTTPPGTGQPGTYAGFLSLLFNMKGTTTGTATWSGLGYPPGYGFPLPPDPPLGTPSGTNVNGIAVGVGFNPPVTQAEFPLWFATLTVGSADVQLNTAIQPTSLPPQTGIEVALSGIMSPLLVSHFMTALNGSAVVHVPAPAGAVVLALGGFMVVRRRR